MPWAPRAAMALDRSTAVWVSLLPAPASTGTLPASSRVRATTRSCSSTVMVEAPLVWPQGTSTPMWASPWRRTSRRKAGSSRAPVLVNGVISAVPAPANERLIGLPPCPHSPSRTVIDVAEGAQLFAGIRGGRLLALLALREQARVRPFALGAIEEEVELAPRDAQGFPFAPRDVARLRAIAEAVVKGGARAPVVERRVHELVALVEGGAEISVGLGEEARSSPTDPARHRAQHAGPGEFGRVGHLDRVEDGGHEIEGGGEFRGPLPALGARHRDDERDGQTGVEEVLAVIEIVIVLAEALAVVGGQDHRRLARRR